MLERERQPDGVLFVGGILGAKLISYGEKLNRWEDFFDGLGKLGVFTAMAPGADAAPLREFLRLAKDAEMEYPNLHVAHASLVMEGQVAVCGLGGELTETEDRTDDRLCYSRASTEYFLRTLWQVEKPRKVLLLSTAPPGELGGDSGNAICGDLIDSYHPSLCVVAGDTQRRGFQQVAHTLVVNPGRLADGSTAWLDWSRRKGEQLEFLDVASAARS
jgi:hypothetical protein